MAREASQVIIRLAGQAPHRRQPLSSNVRRHIIAIRLLVAGSFLLNLLIVGSVVFTAPAVNHEISGLQGVAALRWWATVGAIVSVASLPWLYAYWRAGSPRRTGGALAIAIVSFVAAVIALLPAVGGPPEALGYYVLIYLLVVWGTLLVVAIRS